MSVTIAFLVPIVSLSALALLYLVLGALRSSRTTELRLEHSRFTQNVVEQDAAIQKSLLDELFEGRSPAECLAAFERQRAALLPGARLEDAAAWDTDELAEFARRRFKERVAAVNHKLGIAALTATVVIVAGSVILSVVLYNFQPAGNVPSTAPTPNAGTPADPPPTSPDIFSPPQASDPGASGRLAPDAAPHGVRDASDATPNTSDTHRTPSNNELKGSSS